MFQAIYSSSGKLQPGGDGIEELTVRFVGQLVEMELDRIGTDLNGLRIARLEAKSGSLAAKTRHDFPEQFDGLQGVTAHGSSVNRAE